MAESLPNTNCTQQNVIEFPMGQCMDAFEGLSIFMVTSPYSSVGGCTNQSFHESIWDVEIK